MLIGWAMAETTTPGGVDDGEVRTLLVAVPAAAAPLVMYSRGLAVTRRVGSLSAAAVAVAAVSVVALGVAEVGGALNPLDTAVGSGLLVVIALWLWGVIVPRVALGVANVAARLRMPEPAVLWLWAVPRRFALWVARWLITMVVLFGVAYLADLVLADQSVTGAARRWATVAAATSLAVLTRSALIRRSRPLTGTSFRRVANLR